MLFRSQAHAGVFRHAGDKQFYIFDGYQPEPTANTIDPTDLSFHLATLHTNLTANTANVTQTLTLSPGSTLYANGDVYHGGTVHYSNGFNVDWGTSVSFFNNDNDASVNIYNDGNLGVNHLRIGGDIQVDGNVKATGYYFGSGNESITTDGSSVILNPDNNADALAGVKISGNGFILGPNGARNLALNYNGVGGQVGAYNLNVYSGTNSTAYNNGALVVQGGVGV